MQIVEDIAATLQVRRADLNVVAASKGLFGGALKILGKDGVLLEGGSQVCPFLPSSSTTNAISQGALIPPTQLIDHIDCPNISWVLIIEKEVRPFSFRPFLPSSPPTGRLPLPLLPLIPLPPLPRLRHPPHGQRLPGPRDARACQTSLPRSTHVRSLSCLSKSPNRPEVGSRFSASSIVIRTASRSSRRTSSARRRSRSTRRIWRSIE